MHTLSKLSMRRICQIADITLGILLLSGIGEIYTHNPANAGIFQGTRSSDLLSKLINHRALPLSGW